VSNKKSVGLSANLLFGALWPLVAHCVWWKQGLGAFPMQAPRPRFAVQNVTALHKNG